VDRDHELSAVLADDTRYRIYRSIAEHPGEDATVADVAARFHLHANVARMHLSKLEQAGFLTTTYRRNSGGGRPAKLYRLSDEVVTFGFPPRRYELLSRLAVASLAAGGSRDDAMRACREAGAAEGRHALSAEARAPQDSAEAAALVRRVAEEQGLLPDIDWNEGVLRVTVRNCTFREVSFGDPELVCDMHRAFLTGVLEVVTSGLGRMRLQAEDCAISCGDNTCELLCSFPGSQGSADASG